MASTRGRWAAARAQRLLDAAQVVLGIALRVGIPLHLLAPHHLAVDHRRRLAVAAPQVEADAAAVEVPAQRGGAGALGRQLAGGHHLERAAEDPLAHRLGIEAAGGAVAVVGGEPGRQLGRPVEVEAEAAARPERQLGQPLEVDEVGGRLGVGRRQQLGLEVKHRAVGLLEREAHAWPPASASALSRKARRLRAAGRKSGSRLGTTPGATSASPVFVEGHRLGCICRRAGGPLQAPPAAAQSGTGVDTNAQERHRAPVTRRGAARVRTAGSARPRPAG